MNRTTQEENKLLASLTVFRELYNSENDVYGIISVFINDIIESRGLHKFSLNEITSLLNDTFEFKLPPAVVNTAVNRLDYIKREHGNYIVTNSNNVIKRADLDRIQSQRMTINHDFVERLFSFIEEAKNIKLSEAEKHKISHSFYSFLLDEQNGDQYIEYITAFILTNEHNEGFKNQLNLIREGVILYSGIKFNNNLNDRGWNTQLTIFIETEILFHLAGFNGELYRELVLDFLSYVSEINTTANKKLIRLRYFQEEKIEIESFFSIARRIVSGEERLNPKVTAMGTIVNGCKRESDVSEKKTDFYSLLKTYDIQEDDFNRYFDEENYQYNIISTEILDRVSTEIGMDASGYLKPLNYVSIRRRERNSNSFENIAYILLSGKSITIKLAWNDLIKNEGDVPLATYLSFLTNKFWFRLNKGFGETSMPKAFNIITKSQMILSKVLNENVGQKYTELQREFKLGNLTKEQATARLVDLRHQVKKPEEIKYDTINDVLNAITEDSIEKFKEEQQLFKNKAEEQRTENIKLTEQLVAKEHIEEKLISAKQDLLKEKKTLKQRLEKAKGPLDKKAKKKYKYFKIYIGMGILLYYLILIFLTLKLTWEVAEMYTYFFGFLPFLGSVFFLLIYESNINPLKFLEGQRLLIVKNIYEEFNFDVDDLDKTIKEIEEIEIEIGILERQVIM